MNKFDTTLKSIISEDTQQIPYEYKKLLSDAIYIINQLKMGFDQAEKHLEMNFRRVSKNRPDEMVRIHLPQYLDDDSAKFIANYKKIVKN